MIATFPRLDKPSNSLFDPVHTLSLSKGFPSPQSLPWSPIHSPMRKTQDERTDYHCAGCFVLVGCKEQGSDFVGQWRSADETITVEKAGDGFRVTAELGNPDMPFGSLESMLDAESETLLVRKGSQKKALELSGDGSMISHLRNKARTFSKVD
ncbi:MULTISPECIES: hypothetical protein [Stutzerimonas]|uniref:Uncharacterized protein n=1 Tax=Stutzerimonas zhaodongensis TaxID=1176257 RepID=A0ABX8J7T4_9GAMM|nr:hypothetical protein [Stutzerimonas zhaodongensis]QWV19472.1 hypothetical protein KQ248_22850 [Stutzerimonas zhaodongensis]